MILLALSGKFRSRYGNPSRMSDAIYLAGDLSGIQRFVLGVKSAGKAQAKRLRARSFLLELYEHAALWTIQRKFQVSDEDVLIRGGGGFLVRLSPNPDSILEQLGTDLQSRLWIELGGEVQFTLGWGGTPIDARARLEYRKRRPGSAVLQRCGGWDMQCWSRPPLDDPCQVCGQFSGTQVIDEEDESVLHCRSCLDARRIGSELTRRDWIRAGGGPIHALGVGFELLESVQPDAWRVGRWVPRKPCSGRPLTFEELSRRSRGDSRLAVLKADVDDMGTRVAQMASADSSYGRLRSFSRSLHTFFGEQIQELLKNRWPFIYTLYAGGDDLLLVGPWDTVLDFAEDLVREFQEGPAGDFGSLTFSAGISMTPYRIPIRHAVERAEELLDSAKRRPGKNRCAALGIDWTWEHHGDVIGNGKRIAESVDAGDISRGLIHRLLHLIESGTGSNRALRAARWAYQVDRNVFRPHGRRTAIAGFRHWADCVIGYFEHDEQRVCESAASLRYALLATRTGRGRHDA